MERDVLFAEIENGDIKLEPEPSIFSFPSMPDQLWTLPLAKKIIFTRVSSDYSCLKALSRAQSPIRLNMASRGRQPTVGRVLQINDTCTFWFLSS